MKKKIDQLEINSLKTRLYYKIFTVIMKNETPYYLDKDFNLIWDKEKDVVGIIYDNKNIFFEEIDNIIKEVENTNIKNILLE